MVHIDGDHSYASVVKDLSTALDLFPQAIIVGDDFNWDDVRRAVETVAAERGIAFEEFGTGWRMLRAERVGEERRGERGDLVKS